MDIPYIIYVSLFNYDTVSGPSNKVEKWPSRHQAISFSTTPYRMNMRLVKDRPFAYYVRWPYIYMYLLDIVHRAEQTPSSSLSPAWLVPPSFCGSVSLWSGEGLWTWTLGWFVAPGSKSVCLMNNHKNALLHMLGCKTASLGNDG